MATTLRSRPAHAPGPTFLSYTPNGKKLITVGMNSALRIFEHGSDDEPAVIDVTTDGHLAVAATNRFFVVGTEDGSVTKYSLATNSMDEILTRCAAPVRDIALSPDEMWCAVASDELEVKIVNTGDSTKVMYLREQIHPVKHVSFDTTGSLIAVSCSHGLIYIYSLSSEQPQLIKRIDGLVQSLDTDSESSSKAYWHPDGRAFAAPTSTKDFHVIARSDWQRQKTFSGGHRGEITAAAWSPNGALLATAGADKSLVLWETQTQKLLKSWTDVANTILAMHWHPTENILSYTNNNGELFIRENFVPNAYAKLRDITLQPAPLNSEPLSNISGNSRKATNKSAKHSSGNGNENDYIDALLNDAMSDGGIDFIDDDDGAGYAEEPNPYGKRTANGIVAPRSKRHAPSSIWQPQIHEPFQPGSTPWKGNRRYLCLNFVGFVWTVNQETHNTVTVEFYDRQAHRDFHFTDAFMYDKACLSEKGTLFSCRSTRQHPAIISYRPHETWTTRADWRTQLPPDEEVTSISLSQSCIVATTSAGYVRVYSLFGLPLKIYRQKSTPAVTCASWRDYVMTIGNGPVVAGGGTRLLYTIENIKRDETCQSEDVLALPEDVELKSLFFSDKGDPCIFDSDGVLLVLLNWRTPGQAKWVPLLDTKLLERLADGKKEETYWPVAVADEKFYCIILKGGEEHPYFPRPLLSDFDFRIPITHFTADKDDKDVAHQQSLEEQYVRKNLQYSLLRDLIDSTNATHAQKADAARMENDVDKLLIQLLAAECREGEERGMKALEIATLTRDRSGKILDAAGKVAARFQRDILSEKIMQLAERRVVGLVDDDDI